MAAGHCRELAITVTDHGDRGAARRQTVDQPSHALNHPVVAETLDPADERLDVTVAVGEPLAQQPEAGDPVSILAVSVGEVFAQRADPGVETFERHAARGDRCSIGTGRPGRNTAIAAAGVSSCASRPVLPKVRRTG